MTRTTRNLTIAAVTSWAAATGATAVARNRHRRYRGMLDHAVGVARERDALRDRIADAVTDGRIPIPPAVAIDLGAPLVAGRPSYGKDRALMKWARERDTDEPTGAVYVVDPATGEWPA
jgi:hypothetical protein